MPANTSAAHRAGNRAHPVTRLFRREAKVRKDATASLEWPAAASGR